MHLTTQYSGQSEREIPGPVQLGRPETDSHALTFLCAEILCREALSWPWAALLCGKVEVGRVRPSRWPSTVCLNLDLVVFLELLCWTLGPPQRLMVQVIVLQWLPGCVQEGLEPLHGPPEVHSQDRSLYAYNPMCRVRQTPSGSLGAQGWIPPLPQRHFCPQRVQTAVAERGVWVGDVLFILLTSLWLIFEDPESFRLSSQKYKATLCIC